MTDLPTFLLARLEDEFKWIRRWYHDGGIPLPDGEMLDLSQMLSDVDAKSRILAAHHNPGWLGHKCPDEAGSEPYSHPEDDDRPDFRWCTTLRLLALPYADHPHYDEAWRP